MPRSPAPRAVRRRGSRAPSLGPLGLGAAVLAMTVAFANVTDPARAQDGRMTVDHLASLVTRLDPGAERVAGTIRFTVEDVPVLLVTDAGADRMRVMVPIRSAEGLAPEEMRRMMQANFDTTLDARYALAEGRVWAVYVHPLASLRDAQLLSGIGQTVNAALSYGTLYSSGALAFGRGDSAREQRERLDRLVRRGLEL